MKISLTVDIYTDGSCFPNPGGRGGWAAIVRIPSKTEVVLSGSTDSTTNNRMELMAVISALEFLKNAVLPELCPGIEVHSDSTYVVKPINSRKYVKWSKEVARVNRDLWERLTEAIVALPVKVTATWVRGHAGHPENERCDAIAEEQRGGTPYRKPRFKEGWCGKRSFGPIPPKKTKIKMPPPTLHVVPQNLYQESIRARREALRRLPGTRVASNSTRIH